MSGPSRRGLATLLMGASGFAGLGYQVVWTQQAALWLGHESAAVLAVVAAFFGGLAASALLVGDRIERSARPRRWYVACEVLVGAWSLALALLMAPASDWLQSLTGVPAPAAWQWTVAFCGTFVLLLPATAAMGATLPAIERLAAGTGPARSIAPLYAANTLGAVAGVLATAFWLVPGLGLAHTASLCCALNLACAALAFARLPREVPPPRAAAPRATPAARRALARLAATGLLGIGYEVLAVRVLSQVCEDTVYTFALLLAVYLVGSAGGAALHGRLVRRTPVAERERLADRLLHALALACLVGAASLWLAARLHAALAAQAQGVAGAIAVEGVLALAAFALPTVAMGAVFSELSARAVAGGASFGRALGVNTLGAALAPGVFGVLAVPAIGPGFAVLGIALGYLALVDARRWRTAPVWMTAFAAVAIGAWAPTLRIVDVPEGGRIVRYDEGAMAAVSVVADAEGVMRLRIDNREQEGSSSSGLVDGRMALLPVLLHPGPRRALFLGLGTGVTSATASVDPALRIDAVELLPGVVDAAPMFTQSLPFATTGRVRVMTADARRYVQASGEHYDLIVSDNFHPARSGSGALYTVEHFRAVRARLAPGGVFCQWLPLHQLDLDTTRSIVGAFLGAFPRGAALLASNSLETPVIGLVGRADDGLFDPAQARARLRDARFAADPADYGLDDEYALLGSFVAGPRALARFAASAPVNTDDHPVVAYRAPFIAYAPDAPAPRDRLLALLREAGVAQGEVVADDAAGRFAAYRRARDRFIEIGRDVRPTGNAGAMLAQVREPLLDVLHTSPDFRPAYDPLLRMAVALGRTDAPGASTLLQALARVQPGRREASQALASLASSGS